MDPKVRRRHLHASVSAATLYGMAIGLWIGLRAQHAGWVESLAFGIALMVVPGIVMSRIDARYKYTD